MSYQTIEGEPDITIRIEGRSGSGKSCLMGDIAAMLELYGCEVRCFTSRRFNSDMRRVTPPAAGHFEALRKVRIVEVV